MRAGVSRKKRSSAGGAGHAPPFRELHALGERDCSALSSFETTHVSLACFFHLALFGAYDAPT